MALHNTLRFALAAVVVAGTSPTSAQSSPACVAGLIGTWEGPGRVAGRDVRMRQNWSRSLQNAFVELSMLHLSPADSTHTLFSGRGFYRSTRSDSIGGTWLDSRGLTFQLSGTCRDRTLHVEWIGSAERGDTQYSLQPDGSLAVVDRVMQGTNLREFGRSRLLATTPSGPTLVGPGIISTDLPEFATSISADGNELWFNRTNPDRSRITLFHSRRSPNGDWTTPQVADFPGEFNAVDPFLTHDGKRLYFSSDRPRPGRAIQSFSSWYVERTATGWSAPVDPGEPFNSDSADVFLSADQSGVVVFRSSRDGLARFYSTREMAGRWAIPVALPIAPEPRIGNPAISPTGRFLVFTRIVPGRGVDLFVSCRKAASFDAGRPLSDVVNGPFTEFAPAFSPDERMLYFTSERPGVAGPVAEGVRPPGDLYQISWNLVKPGCAVN